MQSIRKLVCAALALLLLICTGCSGLRYRDMVEPAVRYGVVPPGADHIDFLLRDAKSGEPVPGFRLTIQSAIAPIDLTSDSEGWIRVPLSEAYLKENPLIDGQPGRKISYRAAATFTAGGGHGAGSTNVTYVSVEGKSVIRDSDLRVIYTPELKAEAERALAELRRERESLRSWFGLEPIPWSILLLNEKTPGTAYAVAGERESRTVFCFSVEELETGALAQKSMHEWAEFTIAEQLRIYNADPRNRFIGDGLAEWAVFRHAGLPPDYAKPIHDLVKQGEDEIDLLRRFQVVRGMGLQDLMRGGGKAKEKLFPPGYPLSFLFWWQLSENHGNEVPARFLRALGERNDRSAPSCIKLLEDLTNVDGLRRGLVSIDLRAAAETLAALTTVQSPIPQRRRHRSAFCDLLQFFVGETGVSWRARRPALLQFRRLRR